MGARADKYKLGGRIDKHKVRARAGKLDKLESRTAGQAKGLGAGQYKYTVC